MNPLKKAYEIVGTTVMLSSLALGAVGTYQFMSDLYELVIEWSETPDN